MAKSIDCRCSYNFTCGSCLTAGVLIEPAIYATARKTVERERLRWNEQEKRWVSADHCSGA
jgi:hypothetical protein